MTDKPLPPDRDEPRPIRNDDGLLPGLGRSMKADRGPFAAFEGWTLSLESDEDRDMPGTDPYARRSLGMALLAHGILAAMLVIGVQWVTRESAPMQAELWGAMPEMSPPPPPPPVEPEPKPEPKPVPKPESPPPPPPKPQKAEQDIQADIALKAEKKRKEEEKKREAEEKKREEKERKRQEELEKEELKRQEIERKRVENERKRLEEQEKAEQKRKEEAERKRREEMERVLQRELERERERERDKALSDLMNRESQRAMGTPQAGGGAGANRDPGWIDRIIAKVRSNIVGTACDSLPGNPEAIFMVEQLRNGTVIKVVKRKSSGSVGCDDAIERAINKSDPLPVAKEGSYVRDLELSFKPKEGR